MVWTLPQPSLPVYSGEKIGPSYIMDQDDEAYHSHHTSFYDHPSVYSMDWRQFWKNMLYELNSMVDEIIMHMHQPAPVDQEFWDILIKRDRLVYVGIAMSLFVVFVWMTLFIFSF